MHTMGRLTLLIVFVFSIGLSSAYGIPLPSMPSKDPGAARKDLSNITSDALANADVYTKDEVDNLTAQSTLRYYFQEMNSDVTDYESFATSPVAIQATEAKALGTTIALLDQWVTPANTPNLTTLVTGVYEVIGYLTKSGVGTSYLVTELWIYHADTTSTFVASSTIHSIATVEATPISEVFRFNVATAITTLATDRLVVKLYGYRGASAAALVLYYGRNTGSYFGVPISPRNFLRVDGSNSNGTTAANVLSTATGNATFTHTLNVTGLLVGGVDVLGDISAALAAIIGE